MQLANPTSLLSEKAVLLLVAKGDESAFAKLFHLHKDRVYSIALAYTEQQVIAEEIVQDVFTRVWKHREKLPEIEEFKAWLYTIARNRSLTALEKIAREGRQLQEMISYLPAAAGMEDPTLQRMELQQLLKQALAQLSPQQRTVFELSRLKGLTREEIADELQLSPATVSVHLTIALRRVRGFLYHRMDLPLVLLLAGAYS